MEQFGILKKSILTFIRPVGNSILNRHNLRGLKLFSQLCLRLSHFREHELKHSLQNSLKPLCRIAGIETDCYTYFTVPVTEKLKDNISWTP